MRRESRESRATALVAKIRIVAVRNAADDAVWKDPEEDFIDQNVPLQCGNRTLRCLLAQTNLSILALFSAII